MQGDTTGGLSNVTSSWRRVGVYQPLLVKLKCVRDMFGHCVWNVFLYEHAHVVPVGELCFEPTLSIY